MSEDTTGHDGTKRARAKPVAAKRFITIYQASESVAEVAEKTGLTVHTVSQRASTYRKKGVPLKAMPNSGSTVRNDWGELAELARSLMPEGATTVASAATEEE
ncbi:MAG: hypothetical protein CMA07_00005 [Euryarchaeota archaeon]|nr:hypothetical protein [Euryarchaeota archaeon]|tara:strand:+ start:294 stop:602 length:309 start_codon:yes stop_codon:yes gene_type:complete